jgi:nucleolin
MSNQELASTIVEWLERRGYEQVARALRRDAGLSGRKVTPNVKLEEFSNHVNKDINRKLLTFRNDSYREKFEDDKDAKKRKQMDGQDDDYFGEGGDERSNKRQKSNDTSPATPLLPLGTATNRLFLGNLAFKITETKIQSFFADCGEISNIQWVTDKTTGNFYGTAFIEFDSLDAAQKALSKNGKKCMERPIKINFCGHRQEANANPESQQRKMPPAPKWSDHPEGCKTLFMGNLSFEIQEEQVRAFFGHCGEIYEVRWAYRDDGEFKGIGWVEFNEEDSLQKAVKLHGKALAGRPVRLDFA